MAELSKQVPVLLTKAEALDFVAAKLTEMAANMDLVATIADPFQGDDVAADLRAKLAEQRRLIPEPKLQATACRAAAGDIRALALEERLIAARIAAKSGGGVNV